ncbi:MAG: ATP-dependent Clp protease proteolytic subunit [Puniceicoccales bacterium]|jgi:ATP-dependent Clp protease protease subunit|nr:ATP-dependent Clp protease proteolytic subunit [Puniceicoccales bacterium]
MPLPYVYEKDGRTERSWDIYSRLLKDRIVFLGTPINDQVANAIIAQLLFLQMDDSRKDINLYVNCPGGEITASMAIFDTINFMQCDVATYCVGQAMSFGTLLLAAGTKGKRYALPNSRIMIHQPSGGAHGQSADIYIAAKEILRWKLKFNDLLSSLTGQSVEKVTKDSDRVFYMTAQEAITYGIIDEISAKRDSNEQENL